MYACLQGDYGPFIANVPLDVPLYLAMALYRRGKCRIIPPAWMDKDNLRSEWVPERTCCMPMPMHGCERAGGAWCRQAHGQVPLLVMAWPMAPPLHAHPHTCKNPVQRPAGRATPRACHHLATTTSGPPPLPSPRPTALPCAPSCPSNPRPARTCSRMHINTLARLAELLEEERLIPSYFQALPRYYIQVSRVLLAEARIIFGSKADVQEVRRWSRLGGGEGKG